jgi:GT2 family glycosyltransferase
MENYIKIYIIIVTYNGRKWYDNCFGSLRKSSIPIHVIVIDNASTDDTVSYIKETYPEIHLIENSKNLGFGGANNRGIEYALGQGADYVYLLNQDAWVEPNTFETMISVAQNNKDYGILSPMQITAKGDKLDKNFAHCCSNKSCPNLIDDLYFNTLKDVYEINEVMAAHWLISRECIMSVGGFAPLFFHYGEDNNFVDRTKYHKYKVGIVPVAKAVHDRENRETSKNKHMYVLFCVSLFKSCDINKGVFFSICSALSWLLFQSIKNRSFLGFKYILKTLISIPQILLTRKKTKKNKAVYLEFDRK